MSMFVVIIVVLLISGIIYLAWQPKQTALTQDDFLNALAKYVEGAVSEIPGKTGDYRITFDYHGFPCTYEEVQIVTLQSKLYQGRLTMKTSGNLTIMFGEKKAKRIVRPGLDDSIQRKEKQLALPQSLHMFDAHANDKDKAERLLAMSNVRKMFDLYKYVDASGYPNMPLTVTAGVVTLEFSSGKIPPELNSLRTNIPSIEKYLGRLEMVAQGLNEVEKGNQGEAA